MFRSYCVKKIPHATRIPLHLCSYADVDEWCNNLEPTYWELPRQWKIIHNNIIQNQQTGRILLLVPRMPYFAYDECKKIFVHLWSGTTIPEIREEPLKYERK